MKKNILTIVITAGTCINLLLLIVITFSVVPEVNKSNALVSKVASIIDLNIEAEAGKAAAYKFSDLDIMNLLFTEKETINIKSAPGDTKTHYAMLSSIYVSLNKTAEGYSDIQAAITTTAEPVQSIVKSIIAEYTDKNISEKTICEEAVKQIQNYYNSKVVVRVSLGGFLYQ